MVDQRRRQVHVCLNNNDLLLLRSNVDGHVSRDEGYLFDELEVHVPAFTIMHQITIRLVLL